MMHGDRKQKGGQGGSSKVMNVKAAAETLSKRGGNLPVEDSVVEIDNDRALEPEQNLQ